MPKPSERKKNREMKIDEQRIDERKREQLI